MNNHIGVPLTLLSITPDTEIGIIEMGANHRKEIAFLCTIANPDYGYITNFGKAHLEGFGSIEGVIEAKSELYDYIETNKKPVFVNPNDSIQVERTEKINRIFFNNSIQLLEANPFVKVAIENNTIQTHLIGNYNYNNIAAAITIGMYFNVSLNNITKALEGYTPQNNRSQVINTQNNNTIILDAYNANPSSMKVALDNFSQLKSSNKVVILGDMFELGANSTDEHQFIVDYCNSLALEQCCFVGELFNNTTTSHQQFVSFEQLENYLTEQQFQNTHLLVKGSRGMALERVLKYIS